MVPMELIKLSCIALAKLALARRELQESVTLTSKLTTEVGQSQQARQIIALIPLVLVLPRYLNTDPKLPRICGVFDAH
ncbi:hypothetical protein PCNPT3_07760 [Psychromonas sp. CNPT3]|nr:hypothetical protein PCNPT3_07760 [Psychromonas sp. CNPT3]